MQYLEKNQLELKKIGLYIKAISFLSIFISVVYVRLTIGTEYLINWVLCILLLVGGIGAIVSMIVSIKIMKREKD